MESSVSAFVSGFSYSIDVFEIRPQCCVCHYLTLLFHPLDEDATEKLENIRDHERKEETFTPMPSPYYMELTKLLLNHASDNIPKADEIRTLIKDVWDTRIAKLRVSADRFVREQEAHAKLDNLTLMEINTSGAFLTQALNHMYKLRTNLQPSPSTQSQDF
nr:DNA replication complex GINS protein PSF2 isoform X2 [Equus asinus]